MSGLRAMFGCGPDLGIARFVDEIVGILVAGVVIVKPQHCRLAPTSAIAISLNQSGVMHHAFSVGLLSSDPAVKLLHDRFLRICEIGIMAERALADCMPHGW